MTRYPEMYCRYRNGLRDIYQHFARIAPKSIPRIIWLCGPTGCGKTRRAFDMMPLDTWINNGSCQWFDGYRGQSLVILDDFRKEQLPREGGFGWFLRLLDRYPMDV
jgi:hypothetical protein